MPRMHNPAHPGEVLREYLPEGLAIREAAKRLGVTRQALSALLNGRADPALVSRTSDPCCLKAVL
jgi:plasmid maintenance system antidote protein VapI